MDTDQRTHLELIQSVISRMASNSFLIRGWSVSLVSALFVLAERDGNPAFAIVAYFPCVFFWLLDAYYVSQERKFRSLYDRVRKNAGTDYGMNTAELTTSRDSWLCAFLSPVTIIFHGAILAAISIAMVFFPR